MYKVLINKGTNKNDTQLRVSSGGFFYLNLFNLKWYFFPFILVIFNYIGLKKFELNF